MIELGSRARRQPPPPHVVFESLTQPHREAGRPWLTLVDGEHFPRILAADRPNSVTWSSLWPRRPDAVICGTATASEPTPGHERAVAAPGGR